MVSGDEPFVGRMMDPRTMRIVRGKEERVVSRH